MRRPGIEPEAQEWESWMLPLHQRRLLGNEHTYLINIRFVSFDDAWLRGRLLAVSGFVDGARTVQRFVRPGAAVAKPHDLGLVALVAVLGVVHDVHVLLLDRLPLRGHDEVGPRVGRLTFRGDQHGPRFTTTGQIGMSSIPGENGEDSCSGFGIGFTLLLYHHHDRRVSSLADFERKKSARVNFSPEGKRLRTRGQGREHGTPTD